MLGHNEVLQPWLDARLCGYGALWRAVVDRAIQQFKEDGH